MSDAKDTANRLLPAAILHPAFLLLAGVLPQVVLVFFNLRVYGIVCGELGPEGRSAYAVLFGGQGVLLAALLGAWAACRARRRMVGPAAAAGLLLLHAVFLWIVCSRAAGLVPSSVAFWMVNVGQVLFAQFALIAPLLFYVLIRLAGWGAGRVRAAVDIGASAGALVGIPAFWFLAARFLFDRRWFPHADSIFIPVVLFASTPVMLLAFLRLLLWGYAAVGQSMALLVVSGLLLPLGGLALNRSLPFPCDLQDWRVYALTVLNSAALCLPFSATRLRGGLPWMARAVMYPFSLYFFLLFLPFLPFSIPAVLAAGGGFLVLAPTALFVIHSRRLWEEGRALAGRWGVGRTAAAFAALCLLVPGAYTAGALGQRHSLNAAMTAVFSPDYSEARVPLNRHAAQLALRNLRRTKEGFYLPFISEYYNRLVFNGMTLPDSKIETMERVLFDRAQTESGTRRMEREGVFSLLIGAGARPARRTPPMPSRQVDATATVNISRDGALRRATVTVVMTNRAAGQAECVRELTVPKGVVVSGFWLGVDGRRVPGRVFDRKTAAWMYHMIRDEQRRDPGLLQYKDSQHLELRVFPFASGEVRECGIELVYPAGSPPPLLFGESALPLADSAAGESAVVVTATPRSSSALVPRECATNLPAIRRTPYLHFLIDVSASAAKGYPLYAARIKEAVARNRGVDYARVDLVNHETETLTAKRVAAGDVPALVMGAKPRRFEGGFWTERAIRHALTEWKDSADFLGWVPVFVVVTGRSAVDIASTDPGPLSALAPDSPRVYRLQDPVEWQGRDIVMLACGDLRLPLPADQGGWAVFDSPGGVRMLAPGRGTVDLPGAVKLGGTSVYAQAADGWALAQRAAWRPREGEGLRAELLAISRESGILLPSTAYIVVENSAQWRFLELKEKQSMTSKSALEFDEFKEPHAVPDSGATGWLLGVALVALFLPLTFFPGLVTPPAKEQGKAR